MRRDASTLLFATTVGLSAFLGFSVQPLLGKATLPIFGGGPSVWTTVISFFQLVLLAGYGYAHGLSRLKWSTQVAIHGALLLIAVACLPITPSPDWRTSDVERPAGDLLLLLLRTVGLPYFALSTTSPLLQRWFGALHPSRSPYPLYALSNAGSLLALIAYPLYFERWLDVAAQGRMWSQGFAVFVAGVVLCALGLRELPARAAEGPSQHAHVPRARRSTWLILALIPSWMLLAVTNQLCVDVASAPFLWVLPLCVYLASFILCFGSTQLYHRGTFATLWTVAAVALSAHMLHPTDDRLDTQIGVFLAVLATCCMICHGELARLRPPARELTSFYWFVSLGGALGSLFVTLIAPRIFTNYTELPLGVIACHAVLLLVVSRDRTTANARLMPVIASLGLVVSLPGLLADTGLDPFAASDGSTLAQRRNFYGVLRVSSVTGGRILTHGHIWHGIQRTDRGRRDEATLYYGERTGVGKMLAALPAGPRRLGVIGLGIGTLAHYGRAGDVLRFYEIDPNVIQLAKTYFTFLEDSPARIELIAGDARLSLEREPPQALDALVVDAFSSDAVPVHLLTKEALELYARHLQAGGIVAFHVSNRFLHLVPIVLGAADALKFEHRVLRTPPAPEELVSAASWVLLSKREAALPKGATDHGPHYLWTDARSSLFDAL